MFLKVEWPPRSSFSLCGCLSIYQLYILIIRLCNISVWDDVLVGFVQVGRVAVAGLQKNQTQEAFKTSDWWMNLIACTFYGRNQWTGMWRTRGLSRTFKQVLAGLDLKNKSSHSTCFLIQYRCRRLTFGVTGWVLCPFSSNSKVPKTPGRIMDFWDKHFFR